MRRKEREEKEMPDPQEKQKEPQVTVKNAFDLVKNPNPPVLIVCPLSITPDHNDFAAIKTFAENVENYIRQSGPSFAYKEIKLVLTFPPMKKSRNPELFKLTKSTTQYINKLMGRCGGQYVHAYRVQLENYDFEAFVKAADYALIARKTPESTEHIVKKMNAFLCPCLVLNDKNAEDVSTACNMRVDEKDEYASFF